MQRIYIFHIPVSFIHFVASLNRLQMEFIFIFCISEILVSYNYINIFSQFTQCLIWTEIIIVQKCYDFFSENIFHNKFFIFFMKHMLFIVMKNSGLNKKFLIKYHYFFHTGTVLTISSQATDISIRCRIYFYFGRLSEHNFFAKELFDYKSGEKSPVVLEFFKDRFSFDWNRILASTLLH